MEENKVFEMVIQAKTIDIEKREIRILASDGSIDRDNEIIKPEAFLKHLDKFKANPVILASHKHKLEDGKSPVVGKAVKIWVDKTGLWVVVKFAETELAEEYWQLYRDGFMKAVSVGFIEHKAHSENVNGKMVRVLDEVELYEISCVSIPANPNAVSKSKKRQLVWLAAKKLELKEQQKQQSERSELLDKIRPGWRKEFLSGEEKQRLADEELMRIADPDFSWEKMEKQAEAFAKALMSEDYSESADVVKLKRKKTPDFTRHFIEA